MAFRRAFLLPLSFTLAICTALALLVATPSAANAQQDGATPGCKPAGPYVNPNQGTPSRSSHLSAADVEAELLKLAARSKGALEIRQVGTSGEGRPLYAAVIGTGEERLWVQGRIHGNEPYGAEASLELLRWLVAGGAEAREARDAITFMVIPLYNPDGSEAYVRQDRVHGIDLNRDWRVTQETFDSVNAVRVQRGLNPLPQRVFDNYTSLRAVESQAFWYAWADFKPHYAIDLHHQGTYCAGGDASDEQTTFSLGISIDPAHMDPALYDTIRQMAVVSADAAGRLGTVTPTRYPYIDIPEGVVSGMLLNAPGPQGENAEWTTAAMFYESRGGIGQKSRGYLIRQNVEALRAVVDGIVTGSLHDVDPSRWDDIPPRGQFVSTSDRFPGY